MADTFSTSLNARKQETGQNENTWGELLNSDVIDVFDHAIAGRSAISTTGGTTTLTQTQNNSAILDITGTLGSNAIIQVLNVSKAWLVRNGTVAGGFTLTFKTSGGSASSALPPGTSVLWCNGSDVVRFGLADALAAIGALTPAADKLAYFTSASAAALADLTSYGRSLVAVASEAALKALINLEIGTDVQAFDSDLATIAASITAAGHALLDDANAAAQRTTLGLVIGTDVRAATLPTRQILTSGTGATYTTPAGCRQLRIRMLGGGGGGGGADTGAGAGASGGTTIFNSIEAAGGSGGAATSGAIGAAGGSGGAGSASLRRRGEPGGPGNNDTGTAAGNGGGEGAGRGSSEGSGVGSAASANSGGGGGGGGGSGASGGRPGGGQGEYVELIINSPSATYTYTIGAGGAGGAGTQGGGAGGSGVIIVDEIY